MCKSHTIPASVVIHMCLVSEHFPDAAYVIVRKVHKCSTWVVTASTVLIHKTFASFTYFLHLFKSFFCSLWLAASTFFYLKFWRMLMRISVKIKALLDIGQSWVVRPVTSASAAFSFRRIKFLSDAHSTMY